MADSNHEALVLRLSRIRLPINSRGTGAPDVECRSLEGRAGSRPFWLEVNEAHAVTRSAIIVGRFGTQCEQESRQLGIAFVHEVATHEPGQSPGDMKPETDR